MNCAWATRFRETSTKCWLPTAKGDKLRCLYDVSYGDKRNSYRRRPASEMLYAMIEANGKRTN